MQASLSRASQIGGSVDHRYANHGWRWPRLHASGMKLLGWRDLMSLELYPEIELHVRQRRYHDSWFERLLTRFRHEDLDNEGATCAWSTFVGRCGELRSFWMLSIKQKSER
jgi:hypothetical protein